MPWALPSWRWMMRGLPWRRKRPTKVGVYIGSGIGGLGSIEHYHKILQEKGPGRVSPFFIPMTIINLASGQVAIRLGAKGPNSCAVTACATGNHCIGDAYRLIQAGDADVMIAGGAEAAITPLGVAGFAASKALSFRNDEPTKASRPFERIATGSCLAKALESWSWRNWSMHVGAGFGFMPNSSAMV